VLALFATAGAPPTDPTALGIALGVAFALPVVSTGIWLVRVAQAEADAADARARRQRDRRPPPAPERVALEVLEGGGGRSPGSAKLRERSAPSATAPTEGP
jgi:hypothetical protein